MAVCDAMHCFQIYLLEDFVPTPFVAYGIKHFGCSGRVFASIICIVSYSYHL